ncbi:hypothetical protein N7493_006761 [Penicillium malachiteum]|uniref:Uncharacterized protein n=1 Tax=Penicillium malachiteum TaxID=1324776 RepID=A0AAD6HJD9_9EURO|nr:hypothetical protein N7493_006761 [Penicillium malachiteum]
MSGYNLAKGVAEDLPDPATEKRSQRNEQARENEFFRSCCANFCRLAKAVVDMTQKLILEDQFHSEYTPINALLCRATMALWVVLGASKV